MKRPALDCFEREALAELDLVSLGISALRIDKPWGASIIHVFRSGNGWKFAVFNDAGGWDYLEWAEAPDGRRWKFRDGWDDKEHDGSEALMDWAPADAALWEEAET